MTDYDPAIDGPPHPFEPSGRYWEGGYEECEECGMPRGFDEHRPPYPRLTPEEAERGVVLVQSDDGKFYVANTIVDPETGGVYAQPAEGAGPITVQIVDDPPG